MMKKNVWYYSKPKLIGQPEIAGPFSQSVFRSLIQRGTIEETDLVMNPHRTNGHWTGINSSPPLLRYVREVKEKFDQEEKRFSEFEKELQQIEDDQNQIKESTTAEIDFETGKWTCPFCRNRINAGSTRCEHCYADLVKYPYVPHQWSPMAAALLSFLIPGVGQLYKGQLFNGFCWLIFVPVCYGVSAITFGLALPIAILMHLLCILGAAFGRR